VARALDAPAVAPPGPDLAALLGRVEADVGRDSLLGRLQAWPTTRRRALVLGSFLPVLAFMLVHFGPRADMADYPLWRTIALVLAFGALFVRNAWVAMRPPHEPLEAPGPAAAFALLALFAVTAAAGAPPPYPMQDALCWDTPRGMVTDCFVWGLIIGAPVLVTTLALGRMTTTRALVLSGTAAGLVGNLVLQLDCRNVDRGHLLLGHASLVVAFALVALIVSVLRGRVAP
jgi:hypothetical protein